MSKVASPIVLIAVLSCTACPIGRTTDTFLDADSVATTGTTRGTTGTATGDVSGGGTAGNTAGGTTTAFGGNDTAGNTNTLLVPIANTLASYTTAGRFVARSTSAYTFALPTSRIGGNFTGTSLAVRMADTAYDYFDVILDGNVIVSTTAGAATPPCQPLSQAQITNPNATAYTGCFGTTPTTQPRLYTLATGLAPGNHTAWLIKRTEFYQGSGANAVGQSQFYGFVLDADATMLTPPPSRTRRIDFVGDSGFSGYGAGRIMHDASDYCDFTPANSDAAASVPFYTGEALKADITNVSSSGQGVVHSVYDANPNHLLPVMYEQSLPPSPTPLWNFVPQGADVVVLAGGGDDLNGASGSGTFTDPNAFVSGYVAWVQKVRSHYPDAYIVLALTSGAKTGDIVTLGGALQQVVAQVQAAGDTKVGYFNFFMYDPQYTTYTDIATALGVNFGCKYHPSPAGAKWLGERLARFIAEKMAWTL
jgi:hypothetical protein